MGGPISGYAPTDAEIETELQRLLRFAARHVNESVSDRYSLAYCFVTTRAGVELSQVEHGSDPADVIRQVRATLAALDRWTPDMRPAKHVDETAAGDAA
jgi:hypothetical protein